MSYLKSLSINNFRNIEKLNIDFKPGYNLLIGENGQGKTNLLEAIYFISLLRSFRTSSPSLLKRWNCKENFFYLKATVNNKYLPIDISLSFGDKRVMKLNNNLVSKASDFINQLICIVFSPGDIELVDGSGKVRRRFLDITLSQLHREYLLALQKYNEALKNRNLLLKSKLLNRDVLASFDKVMIENAVIIYHYRFDFFTKISAIIKEKNKIFSNRNFDFSINYNSLINNFDRIQNHELTEIYSDLLKKNFSRDLERGITHVGPHRDDFGFLLSGKKLRDFGSRGQSRLASLLLRLVTSELFFEEQQRDNVIFLVDDVTGELDQEIKAQFFELLAKGKQVFFAATEVPEVFVNHPEVNFFKVNNGMIKRVDFADF